MALAKRIIPCLDVDNGRVVKGVKFENIRDAGDPVEIARRYDEQGADEITFLDITASVDGRDTTLHTVERMASQVFIPLTVGGGVRCIQDINRKQAVLDGEPLALTAYEYRILEYLMRHHQQVVAKDRLMEQLYPDDEERDPNVIEVLVGRLRRKLEGESGFKPIDTVRGLGYLFTERCR